MRGADSPPIQVIRGAHHGQG